MRLRIKELRVAREMSAEELAKAVGCSQGFVSLLESGKRDPSIKTIGALSQVLNVSISELFDASEQNAEIDEMAEIMRDLGPEDRRALLRAASGLLASKV